MRRRIQLALSFVAVTALLACAHCAKNETLPNLTASSPASPATSVGTKQSDLKDADIANAVSRQLRYDTTVDKEAISVSSVLGVVQLRGEVDDLMARERATRLAQMVKGVRSVNNLLEVKPVSRTDDEIRYDVVSALAADPAADAYELTVAVNDGVVTLSGHVESWAEKSLGERVAKGVRGVKDVKNNVGIVYKKHRLDPEIKADIEGRLAWDTLVDQGLVGVAVDDGAVKLTGSVGSAAEKARVYEDAWVMGAKSVDDTGLKVRWWLQRPDLRKDKYVYKADDKIAQAVRDALLLNPRVNGFDVRVNVGAGIVALEGVVTTHKAKAAAEQVAKNTVGVLRVENNIDVRVATPASDETLAVRVRKALARNVITDSFEIGVSVKNGEAVLRGTVDSQLEKAEAEDVAYAIPGIYAVTNELKLRHDFRVFAPLDYLYLYPYHPYVYTWQQTFPIVLPKKTDAELARAIRDELFWSPYVNSSEVDVQVHDGVATLEGEVDTAREKRFAAINAYEGGAKNVLNKLTVARQKKAH